MLPFERVMNCLFDVSPADAVATIFFGFQLDARADFALRHQAETVAYATRLGTPVVGLTRVSQAAAGATR